ncbi:integrase arm-type DNA-binding domain-containing protein [Pseudomonadales bacterium]|nr:integrase arm-type DNA-binding domain-containing protein [Pseudomonadales bacterium]
MALTATKVKNAEIREKPYKLSDEKGMYLLVTPSGSKLWRLKYRYVGKEKTLAFGAYPDITLAEARERRDGARKLLANDVDPGEAKKVRKRLKTQQADDSFQAIATEWFHTKMGDRSESHQKRTWAALKKDLFLHLGVQPIAQITAPDLLMALRKIESRGAIETAHRAKQTAGQIFRYAVATGRAERDPSGDLKGALQNPKKKHLAAITDPKQVGMLLLAMDDFQGTTTVKAALLLSPLLFCRPGELRHMEWEEINWDEERWEIPAAKMKIKQPHIVPLATQSLVILREARRLTGNGRYVFPSARGRSRPLSENGVRTALRTMGYDNDTMTPHGFRAMARTILDEILDYRIDYIEHQLAHSVKDANGRAYNRTAHLPGRRKMMQDWADYLDQLRTDTKESYKPLGVNS